MSSKVGGGGGLIERVECSIPFDLISLPSFLVAITMIHSTVSACIHTTWAILMSMAIFLISEAM